MFCLRLLDELATACQRLGQEGDERTLRDGERPIAERLRLAVEVLNENRVLLVLDNLESLMPLPPAPPAWQDGDFTHFFRELTSRLTGEGRAILTCRYVPDSAADPGGSTAPAATSASQPPSVACEFPPNVAHEPLPDFTEADFFKCLRRYDAVAERMERGELPRALLAQFHRKLGATPRFVEQAGTLLGRIDPDVLREQLEGIDEPPDDASPDDVRRLQQAYFCDLFLPQLYDALPEPFRRALSRLAVARLPLPLDGVRRAAGLDEATAAQAVDRWLGLGLLQRLGEPDQLPLYAVYPLQRDLLTDSTRLGRDDACAAHTAMASFLQECYEQDREDELRLTVEVRLLACLEHATAAEDRVRRRWAVTKLGQGLIQRAEFAAAQKLIEPLLQEEHHPDLLQIAVHVATETGDWRTARALGEEEQKARVAIGDRKGEAVTWHNLATIDLKEGKYSAAREKFANAMAMRQSVGDREGEAITWHNLTAIDVHEGNYAAAREKCAKALAINQSIGDQAGETATWHNLAWIDLNEGNYEAAREKYAKVLATNQAMGDRMREAATWHQLATIDSRTGDYVAAREKFATALAIRQTIGDRAGEASTWHQLASVDLKEDKYAAAREKFAKALAMRQTLGDRAGEASTWHQLGTIDLEQRNYAVARGTLAKALAMRQSVGDCEGEASTWHQLATIDSREGNYVAAREKFAKALAIQQTIGDIAGEAATLYQIGYMAFKSGRHDVGIRLVTSCVAIQSVLGSGDLKETLQGLDLMANFLGLDQEGLQAIVEEAAEQYQRDRGAAWVEAAFEGL